ncbi:membrane progestin receptor gamma-B [Eucyclogobius newberryi]|uniref:membrane progestin receptor gamma-B n=1 Tax=Eucyclogobius newberryi TaxID=166745 RepID=UPI003B5C674A
MLSLIKLPPVLSIDQVPKVFQEDSIMSGYRPPRSSATDCVLSLFQMTNETLNIWTHFLPTWYFVWKLLSVVFVYSAWQDSYMWPLVVYLISICLYPLASSCAHTFSSMSPSARHICFFCDYGALSFYSLGSAIIYSSYVFPDKWTSSFFHRSFIPVAVCNSILCTGLACYSRLGLPFLQYNHDSLTRFPEMQSPKLSKLLRVLAFAYPYLFDHIPLFYRVFLCAGEGCTHTNVLHVYHMALAFLTGFLFATHLPERLAPGSFDYIGHSHQLFHVCAILGTQLQMQAVEQDMLIRKAWLLQNSLPVTFSSSVGTAIFCLLSNVVIISLFSLPLFLSSASKERRAKKSKAEVWKCTMTEMFNYSPRAKC